MSDISGGPGWWQASDGKWYPAEQHPNYQAPAAGTSLPPTGAAAPAGSPPPPTASGASRPAFSLDASRLGQAERITGIATLVLFIALFLPWYTYNFGLGSVSADGLYHGWMYLVLLVSLAVMAYVVLRAGFDVMPFKLPMSDEQLLLIATVFNVVLCILAFLLKPGGIGFSGVGWGFGAFLGLLAAIVAAAPLAVPAIQARRK
jgi:hypothetical protein